MLKEEFLMVLSEKLNSLSETDRTEYMDDYAELIDDRTEAGNEEETVITELGDIEIIAENIIKSIPVKIDESVTYTENHSIIDCTNRYISEDEKYIFAIKIPADIRLKDVLIEITSDCDGTVLFCTNLSYLGSSDEWNATVIPDYDYNGGSHSYKGSDHYKLITEKSSENGMGIRLYLNYNDKYYMATDTALKSKEKGRGYWLSDI